MKTSNKLILALAVVYAIGLLFTDYVLSSELANVRLNDPFKNYQPIRIPAFQSVSIRGGNSYAIRIVQGSKPGMQVMNSRKDFLKYTINDGKLSIEFSVAKSNSEHINRQNAPIGLIITCPKLSSFMATDSYNVFDSLQLDNLSVILKGNSYTSFRKNNVKQFTLIAGDYSYAEFIDPNRADERQTTLSGKAKLRLNRIQFSSFRPTIKEQAEIIFSASAIAQMKHIL